jgi:hypothetical protein
MDRLVPHPATTAQHWLISGPAWYHCSLSYMGSYVSLQKSLTGASALNKLSNPPTLLQMSDAHVATLYHISESNFQFRHKSPLRTGQHRLTRTAHACRPLDEKRLHYPPSPVWRPLVRGAHTERNGRSLVQRPQHLHPYASQPSETTPLIAKSAP